MAIRLHIQSSSNSPVRSARLLGDGNRIELSCDSGSRTVTISRPPKGYIAEALANIIAKYSNNRYITKINGVEPATDGVFYLNGSACDSIVPVTDDHGSHTLGVVDLCPACSKCDTQYDIKRQIEFYNIYFNLIKDINLYDNNVINIRHNDLKGRRITAPNCKSEYGLDSETELAEYNKLLGDVGYMLQNYITAVHMWNYAVSINNNDTLLSSPPEDGCGILVQTKLALTDCSGDRGLRCTIEITPDNSRGGVQENLSVFTPDPVASFAPFSDVPTIVSGVTHSAYTSKRVTTTFGPLETAGTCIVTAKFLPFIYVAMSVPGTSGGVTGASGIIEYYDSITSGAQVSSGGLFVMGDDSSGSGEQSGGEGSSQAASALITGIQMEPSVILEPARAHYEQGKSYPSIAVDGSNYWTVQVIWETLKKVSSNAWAEEPENTIVETRKYVTPRCRVPMNGVTQDSEFIDIQSSEGQEGNNA